MAAWEAGGISGQVSTIGNFFLFTIFLGHNLRTTPSLNMFFIAAIRNWRVDPRRVKDEAIRMLRILTGSI
ncbi:hypothetical protein N0V85_007379 [Neurospora sp. IMI 360204]|nr:hypothetical protein N0V85_007379 [Neurospora sp. IMI 360204]